ncbi:hypothetical protein IP91_01544 [Pseudoduganella lurida]|uniref:Uncharacterized protein n=1 Tax=Pseudoduganella lurida TaxID=1036180 RepID=A0A562REE7_9BURK|nr:hypothetical protein [Pseudoduganella lurida]TWI67431.1 hypothetical protein IP91_01544 [Pseudoduganella lurida]
MHELIAQLLRLYLPAGAAPEGLEAHLDGRATRSFDLVRNGAVRCIVLPFEGASGGWERLCEVANAVQGALGLPAPAVSVSGTTGFRLWLSFARPLAVADAQRFADLLRATHCPEVPRQDVTAPVELPPCRQGATGKWAAFIHPGMGASFAEEPALEMAPPSAAQAAFLHGLESIDAAQLHHALAVLQPAVAAAPALPQPQAAQASYGQPSGVQQDLLLRDATLEDIVRFLHAQNIEPTFRHLLPPR